MFSRARDIIVPEESGTGAQFWGLFLRVNSCDSIDKRRKFSRVFAGGESFVMSQGARGRVWWKFLFFFPRVENTRVTSTRFESRSANCNPFRNFHTPRNTRNRYYVISTVFIPRNYGVSFFLLTLNSPISESNRRFFFPFVYNIFLFAFDIINGA